MMAIPVMTESFSCHASSYRTITIAGLSMSSQLGYLYELCGAWNTHENDPRVTGYGHHATITISPVIQTVARIRSYQPSNGSLHYAHHLEWSQLVCQPEMLIPTHPVFSTLFSPLLPSLCHVSFAASPTTMWATSWQNERPGGASHTKKSILCSQSSYQSWSSCLVCLPD